MEENSVIELEDASVIVSDVEKRIRTTGVKGLDFNKARELGMFQRIANLLCASHASIVAAYRIYGGAAKIMNDFGARRLDISKAMSDFEKAFMKFTDFWTGYYASGQSGIEINNDTENLYRHIMQWAQLPFSWSLGDEQRTPDESVDIAIRLDIGDKQLTFRRTVIDEQVAESSESWCVTKYDIHKKKQTIVEDNMDKASAMMVAKRMSADDDTAVYTASMVQRANKFETSVLPYKSYHMNGTVGKLTKQFR